MNSLRTAMVINNSFPEMSQLAAALAEANMLSRHIRPYANLQRPWEIAVSRLPGIGAVYSRTFGRRLMPRPLSVAHLAEAAIVWDFALAIHARFSFRSSWYLGLRGRITDRRNDSVAMAGAHMLRDERMVVASWTCALPAFEVACNRGMIRVLNYPFAHHEFSRKYLESEAEREPAFARTLNSHNYPRRLVDRMNREIELADHILVGSTFVRDSFIHEGAPATKLEVISYGVDTSLFAPPEEPKSTSGDFKVLFVGQLTQRKGISYLLRAYEQFHGPGTSLTLVGQHQGDGSALNPWRHLFRYFPHMPRQQLAEVFRKSDVFVFPTLMEGMPLVVLEAMASGLPVITTANGPGDIVRDGVDGFIVPPRDIDAIVSCLQRLRADPDLRARMGENARARSREFTWTHYRNRAVSRIAQWLYAPEKAANPAQAVGMVSHGPIA